MDTDPSGSSNYGHWSDQQDQEYNIAPVGAGFSILILFAASVIISHSQLFLE
jgi:hypothetical protein